MPPLLRFALLFEIVLRTISSVPSFLIPAPDVALPPLTVSPLNLTSALRAIENIRKEGATGSLSITVVSALVPSMITVLEMTGKPLAVRTSSTLSTDVRVYVPGSRLIVFSSPFAFAALIASIKPAASPEATAKTAE
jgi:hypothetical protein